MKTKIIAWMQSPRNFYEGAAIYNTYGHNLILKKRFANKNETTEALLLTELCKLAGISENQASKYPRHAKNNTVLNKNSCSKCPATNMLRRGFIYIPGKVPPVCI